MELTCKTCEHVFEIKKKKLAVNCPSCNAVVTLKKKKKSTLKEKPTVIPHCTFDFSTVGQSCEGHILFADDEIYFGVMSFDGGKKSLLSAFLGEMGGGYNSNDGLDTAKFGLRSVIPRALPDDIRFCGKFNGLGSDHKVVIAERVNIQGYKKGWLNITVVCRNKVLITITSKKKEVIEVLEAKDYRCI